MKPCKAIIIFFIDLSIESEVDKVKRKVTLCQKIRPDTLLIAGHNNNQMCCTGSMNRFDACDGTASAITAP